MNPIKVLKNWFAELHQDFGDEMPNPNKTGTIIDKVSRALNTQIVKYLGAGNNGVAFSAADGDVVKYTIDKNEAMLWHRLKNVDLKGIARLKNVLNLSSSKTGDSFIYVVKVEYVAHDLSPQQAKMVSKVLNGVVDKGGRGNVDREQFIVNRSVNLVNGFEDLAEQDPDFEYIPDMIMDLADKHKAHIYDLQPDNFKKNADGKVVLIDPSIPDLIGDVQHPERILFEDKVTFTLESTNILI